MIPEIYSHYCQGGGATHSYDYIVHRIYSYTSPPFISKTAQFHKLVMLSLHLDIQHNSVFVFAIMLLCPLVQYIASILSPYSINIDTQVKEIIEIASDRVAHLIRPT